MKLEKNKSRRNFLSFIGKGTIFFSALIFLPTVSNKDEDEYVLVNGWLLSKKDLNDI